MVNGPDIAERRERARPASADHGLLGEAKLNPFGDLHTLQHLSARYARSLRSLFEPLLRQEVRSWAEPLVVQRFADYRAERGDALTAWVPLTMPPQADQGLCVLDGRFVLELLDLFFGGSGAAPAMLPSEFSPATEAMVERLGAMLVEPLRQAWEPLARIEFVPARPEASAAMLPGFDGDDAMIVTRFGIAAGTALPVFIDLLYPVSALKPHGAALTGKVVSKPVDTDPGWRSELTRAVMGVRFTVRSVLAEPVVPLQTLMTLKPGDVIPISFGPEVPVMVGNDLLGTGTVGAANGHAAVRLTSLVRTEGSLQ
ncbi:MULTISPECIES: flagellar motor switch protein FliM [Sphingomonas]|uniref:Flagellar motor switch protein FliM n=1 Tax=Sphingomonas carotinifaciens TaxID=1166323 RepID=A0A1G7GM57_9SPHN|nr:MULTISPECIES: flagellar motor switch protein FliM [Sphingomonas]MBB4086582.1 flagellar motor switch protein FliM [Sphingomonas carotinifaciens]MWC42933.1 flagellar motor switch protein FliM [Sphingomonas carotinifaciens]SDE89069.1 flagellar motor switch protein FliM [Sphingomonas carotinifaciens]